MHPLNTTRDWLVAKTGNDGNSGHPSTYPIVVANDAKLTVMAAINACVAGDRIFVGPGTFNESVINSKAGLIIRGDSKETTYILSAAGRAFGNTGEGCVISNLRCKCTDSGVTAYGFSSSADRCHYFDIFAETTAEAPGFDLCLGNDNWCERIIGRGPNTGINVGAGKRKTLKDCMGITDGTHEGGGGIPCKGFSCDTKAAIFENCIAYALSGVADVNLAGFYLGNIASLKNCVAYIKHSDTAYVNVAGVWALGQESVITVESFSAFVEAIEGRVFGIYVEDGYVVGGNCSLHAKGGPVKTGWTVTGQVVGEEKTKFIDTTAWQDGPNGGPDDYFNGWTITWTSGNNVGEVVVVDDWEDTPDRMTLADAMPYDIEVGDEYTIQKIYNRSVYAESGKIVKVANVYDEYNTDLQRALDKAIDDAPSVGSIYERIKAMDELVEASGDGDLALIRKILKNKAVFTKSTGAIVFYDDDGVTPILTHTPTDGESTIIRTPS